MQCTTKPTTMNYYSGPLPYKLNIGPCPGLWSHATHLHLDLISSRLLQPHLTSTPAEMSILD